MTAATARPSAAAADAPAVVSGDEQPARTAEEAPAARRARRRRRPPTRPAVTETTPEEPAPTACPAGPTGLTAHTVVLVTSGDRAAALNVAKEARANGPRGRPDPLRPLRPRQRALDRLLGPLHHARGRPGAGRAARRPLPGRLPAADSEVPVAAEHVDGVLGQRVARDLGRQQARAPARPSSRPPSRRAPPGRSRPPAPRPPARPAPARAPACGSTSRRTRRCRARARRAGRGDARRSPPRSGSGRAGTGARPASRRARSATGTRPRRCPPARAG